MTLVSFRTMVPRAKITAPSPHGILARNRLFRRLIWKDPCSVVWISGPPGAGKTSLATSFLGHQSTSHLWYQVDAGDGDPATLFTYLGQAIQRISRRKRPALPRYDPGYVQGIALFSRRFFEALFARLPSGSVLVLDNYQEIPPEAATHEVLHEGFSALPPGVRALVLSRQPPPAVFARLRTNGQMRTLEWSELQMTPAEGAAMLRARLPSGIDRKHAAELTHLAGGWPAGLVLLTTRPRNGAIPSRIAETADRELLFDYFASEVLDHADPELRQVLLRTAVLPRCRASQADLISGVRGAGARLRQLTRSGYFTVEHGHTDPTFEFHPLFRQFLLHRAATVFLAPEWASLQGQAAALLEVDGQIPEAFELFRRVGDTNHQISLIKAHARSLLAQGQYRTLSGWFESLPAEAVREDSLLDLMLGLCRMSVDLTESRAHLEKAFKAFEREGDVPNQMLTWCAIVDTSIYAWDDYSTLDPWIGWLDEHFKSFEQLVDPGITEAVIVSMIWALVHRQPDHPEISRWAQRAVRILREGSRPQIRLRAGTAAVMYHLWGGRHAACETLAKIIHRMAETSQEPFAILTHCWVEAGFRSYLPRFHEQSHEAIEAGLVLSGRSGIHIFDFMFHGQRAAGAIGDGDRSSARRALSAMERVAHGHNGWSFFHYLSSWDCCVGGDLPAATSHAEQAVQEATAAGMPSSEALCRIARAELLFENGRKLEAAEETRLVEALVKRLQSPPIEMLFHLGVARRELSDPSRTEDEALDHLRIAWRVGREHGYVYPLWQIPEWMALLCQKALEHRIEVPFVRSYIRLRGLRPRIPPIRCPDWPWNIRITTLGRFAITREECELESYFRKPWRILLLLKAIIAAGPRGLEQSALLDRLWPEAEGDTARRSMDTGLHRLRHFLGVEGAVVVKERRLFLDPHRCWVDAYAFEKMTEEIGDPGMTERALSLYRGPFLDDLDKPWARSYRERLKARFLKCILAMGERCEKASDLDGAIQWYERGLAAHPSTESLNSRIAHCRSQRFQRA